MNFGLMTSYFIGGILLLSILSMNTNLNRSSGELTLSQITREHTSTIGEMITYDIPKIGYDIKEKLSQPILRADSNLIEFEANLDNSGDVEQVLWEFTNASVNASENPNDRILKRRIKSKSTGTVVQHTKIELGVTQFRIRYYETYGDEQAKQLPTPVSAGDLDKIKQIEIQLVVESDQQLYGIWGGENDFVKSAWEKRFSPGNLLDN